MLAELNFLIVDDDNCTIESLSHLLRKMGATKISVAHSGYQAFVLLSKNRERFDCVITDVCMADGNGLELLYQVRTTTVARTFRPDMCIILMSGIASAEIASVARRLDVNEFLVKPFTANKLQMAIATARRRAFPLNRPRYNQIEPSALNVA